MRKITEQARFNFFAGTNFTQGNTSVVTYMGGLVELQLYEHTIAQYNKHNNRDIIFSLCGYDTQTTRDRLRAIGIDLVRKNGKTYYKGKEIKPFCYYNSGLKA